MRAQLTSSLEFIMTYVAFVSGQLDIWCVKRDEQKNYYEKKLSYQDVKKKRKQKKVAFENCLKSLENKIL